MTSQTKEKLARVAELKKQGLSTKEAVKEVGWTMGAYYSCQYMNRKQKAKKRRPTRKLAQPKLTEIPITDDIPFNGGRIFALVGAPREVMEAIRSVL